MTILSTADVRSVEFNERRKGYDPDEISAFVDDVCETIAAQKDDIDAKQAQLDSLNVRVADIEEQARQAQEELAAEREANRQALEEAALALAKAKEEHQAMLAEMDNSPRNQEVSQSVELLTSAHKTAEETIAKANDEAASVSAAAEQYAAEVRAEADTYADGARRDADAYAADTRADAQRSVEELTSQAAELRASQEAYRERITGVLRSALEFIEGSMTVDVIVEGDEEDADVFDASTDGSEPENEQGEDPSTGGGYFS